MSPEARFSCSTHCAFAVLAPPCGTCRFLLRGGHAARADLTFPPPQPEQDPVCGPHRNLGIGHSHWLRSRPGPVPKCAPASRGKGCAARPGLRRTQLCGWRGVASVQCAWTRRGRAASEGSPGRCSRGAEPWMWWPAADEQRSQNCPPPWQVVNTALHCGCL